MRRSFAYSVAQPSEQKVRADVADIVVGFAVKCIDLQPWDAGGFHVRVELDLPEDAEHVRRDVEALIREHPGATAITVEDSVPFADISWQPFSTRDICLGEYVEVRGSNRQAILWQLFDECRFVMGPADFVSGTWSEGASPTLRLAVTKVLDFLVNGVVPETAEGER